MSDYMELGECSSCCYEVMRLERIFGKDRQEIYEIASPEVERRA